MHPPPTPAEPTSSCTLTPPPSARCPTAPLSSLSDPKPRNYGEVATTVENRSSAKDALKKSCYFKIDFGISEDATVYEAVQRFAAYNIGALAVTNEDKRVIGIVSERDYVSKVSAGTGCSLHVFFLFFPPRYPFFAGDRFGTWRQGCVVNCCCCISSVVS